MVHYFDGKRVNPEWNAVLTRARREGVRFHLNSGWRTLAEQKYLYNGYRAGRAGFNLAAYPNPNAPHIRYRHSCDVNAPDGGASRLAGWLRSKGVSCGFDVRGEPWHLTIFDWAAFQRLARASATGSAASVGGRSVLPIKKGKQNNKAAVKTLQKRLRALGFSSVKVDGFYGQKTRSAVGRFQKANKLGVDYVVGKKTWNAIARKMR